MDLTMNRGNRFIPQQQQHQNGSALAHKGHPLQQNGSTLPPNDSFIQQQRLQKQNGALLPPKETPKIATPTTLPPLGATTTANSDGLEWKDGVGTLHGCEDLKFRKNNLGMVELITNEKETDVTENFEDCDVDESVVEIKGQPKEMNIFQPEINAGNPGTSGQGTDDDQSNVEIISVQSKMGIKFPVATCPICGIKGNKYEFVGRFCTRKCLAKNANMHRGSYYRNKPSVSQDAEVPSVIQGSEDRNSNDLKIRIRLASGSPVEKRELNNVRKRKYTGQTTASITGGARKKKFVWSQYLNEQAAEIAPPVAFQALTAKDPFGCKNDFKLGMALEGVDPKHQSLICPMNVTAVKGNRVRLHFCGFSESYDFWVNADNPLMFPCGFCESTGRNLEPPRGFSGDTFKWEKYMKKFRLYPAPESIFITNTEKQCGFVPGDKLEAVDKVNPDLICVATVSDVIGENLLIHFDGWTNDFDYWCTPSSYLIHPVGWCEKEGKDLTPPEGYTELHFSWPKYFKQTNSKAADEASFPLPGTHSFQKGMKLEVVDPRNPILIRVATIAEISGFRILIHFDGWSDVYDFWTDLESPDLHPVGWCTKTNFPLQPPLTPEDVVETVGQTGGCPVPGCIGVGHVRGSKFVNHHSEFGCPYSLQNLNKVCLNDRLARPRQSSSAQDFAFNQKGPDDEAGILTDPSPVKQRRKSRASPQPANSAQNQLGETSDASLPSSKDKTVVSSSELNTLIDESGKSQYSALHHSVYMSALTSFPNYDLPVCWDQHSLILPSVKGIELKQVYKWSTEEVAKFVSELTGRPELGKVFLSEEIDGEALLLLTQSDISKVLKFKLGPAVKIYNAMLLIKAAEHLPV